MLTKVLAVDDDLFILEFMKELLRPDKYEVFTARDGLEALDVIDTMTPDVIFLDLVMPNIGGERLCRILRDMERLKKVIIVILSSVVSEQWIELEELQVDACIAKGPVDAMAQNVRNVLEDLETGTFRCAQREVITTEEYVPRRITNELLSMGRHREAILEVMHEGILEVVSTGRIVYVNPASESLLGMPEHRLLGLDFFKLFSEIDKPIVFSACQDTIETQSISHECRVHVNHHDLMLRILPVKNRDDLSLVIMFEDVTEKRKMEAELIQAKEREVLGTVVGGISHNFNNVLTAIQNAVSLMRMNELVTREHLDDVQIIEQCVESGAALTRELIKIAKGGKYNLKMTDLNEIVKKSSEIFGFNNREIEIHRKLEKEIWMVDADSKQIEQVLLNLYLNAQQAMPYGGQLFIETQNTTRREKMAEPSEIVRSHYVKISVRDTGKGIDQGTKEKIFDPFFTTKKAGSGLGLATARNTIRGHRGMICVHSKRGDGATFEIFLPASPNQPVRKRFSPDGGMGEDTLFLRENMKFGLLKVARGC